MRVSRWAAIGVAALLWCAPVMVQAQSGPINDDQRVTSTQPPEVAPPVPHEWFGGGLPWRSWSRLTGDWGHLRTRLESRGLVFDLRTVTDNTGASANRVVDRFAGNLTNAALDVDLGLLAGLQGATARVQFQSLSRSRAAWRLPIAQAVSNIDADPFHGIAELWVEQALSPALRVKAGRIDANTEFAFVEHGGAFINAAMGFSPTVFPLPTYPDPRPGVVLRVESPQGAYGVAGAFDGGAFRIAEAGASWKPLGGGRVGVGQWRFREATGDGAVGTEPATGQYAVLDQMLWQGRGEPARTVGLFLQMGRTDPRWSASTGHVGVGLVANGLLPRRGNDTVGVAVTMLSLTEAVDVEDGVPTLARGREMVMAVFHRFALTPWVALRPDVQLIRHPGGFASHWATAGTVRLEFVY